MLLKLPILHTRKPSPKVSVLSSRANTNMHISQVTALKFFIVVFCLSVKLLSCVRLFTTPWTVTYQAPLSMGFSRQQYWSGLPFPSPGDLPDPGIEPGSPALLSQVNTKTETTIEGYILRKKNTKMGFWGSSFYRCILSPTKFYLRFLLKYKSRFCLAVDLT